MASLLYVFDRIECACISIEFSAERGVSGNRMAWRSLRRLGVLTPADCVMLLECIR